jgi:hypothetical protein
MKCGECPLRKQYDKNPTSLIGRFWKWHIKFCPKWKRYVRTLSAEEKQDLINKYQIKL